MSAWALKINHISGLYASIIENVLIGGLNNVRIMAAGDGDEFVDTLDFFHAAQRQQLYLQGDSSSYDTIRSQVRSSAVLHRLADTDWRRSTQDTRRKSFPWKRDMKQTEKDLQKWRKRRRRRRGGRRRKALAS